ncbi:uncharacterized protein DMAD_08210 [Drosophila madeirensis]|uniref:Uncharacterized protein n=1 Tax=Drosophila madeirensis TaxID=30013 RepID=A0AAU9F7K8_DROMD
MTYSHNSVRNNIRMTTASATKAIRLKKGAAGTAASPSASANPSPTSTASAPTTPLVTAHSNSIASSTNINSHFHQQSLSAAASPTTCSGLGLSALTTSSTITTPNSRQQRQQQSQSAGGAQRSRQQPQQRQSPQQIAGGGGGAFFFANNNGSASKRNGGRSPQGTGMVVRQSPATILGGGFSPSMAINGGSARKQRKSPPTIGAFGASPQQQHPLIPTALTHFAGSKCFDAPAPTALPKPPQHWTLCKSEEKLASSAGPALQSLMRTGGEYLSSPRFHLGGKSSKRNLLDDFDTHNLKLLLNVQC